MAAKVYALVDCNNFFVSCERVFRPDLEGKPVAVLSSNDGCVVARSNETKRLGIPMGAPAFKYREIFQKHNIVKFSANFELYGDISKRITALLATITPRIEVYSVDESFLDITALPIKDYEAWGREVRAAILRHVGVPVSIGIAPTKTLAKLAAEIPKKYDAYRGAFSFAGASPQRRQAALEAMPVQDIWGVGWRLAPKLRAEAVGTAWALSRLSPRRAQQLMGINGRKMVSELNGISCYGLSPEHDPAKSILRSRTFGEDTNQMHVLEAAIATLSAQACFALRRENLLARRIGIFTNTNRNKPGYRQWTREIRLSMPTSDTGLVISRLVKELPELYSNRQQYHRLGVYLYDFAPDHVLQTDLLGSIKPDEHDRSQARMQALDTINNRWGRGKIYFAAEDLSKSWQPKHQIRSPRYVSNWNELPAARIV
ncbi:MAG TPA: Y-family DNA polymerase [Candidatus Saccharimonadales bacterium]|nr:Y-family DNA polymerase [Candidatus Saccharimonadales bacterium]